MLSLYSPITRYQSKKITVSDGGSIQRKVLSESDPNELTLLIHLYEINTVEAHPYSQADRIEPEFHFNLVFILSENCLAR